MDWVIKTFDELSLRELYAILQARSSVFIMEQGPYLDPDGLDEKAVHLYHLENGEISAYCRLFPPGINYEEASIGRVLTTKKYRRCGHGKLLMKEAVSYIQSTWKADIQIAAQAYLRRFYGEFGFQAISDEHLEDNIPHVTMLLKYKGNA